MIEAAINNYRLDLESGFSFDLVTQSQLWNFDKLRGDFVPSISFPDTENNRAILNHPNRFETYRSGRKEFENFELRCDGYILIRGTLVMQTGFSGFVRGQIGNLAANNADKLITDYDLPEVEFDNKEDFDPETDDYCAPTLVNKSFFKDISVTKEYKLTGILKYEETILQHYHRDSGYMVNSRTEGIVDIPTAILDIEEYVSAGLSTNVISPMLYLWGTIEKLLNDNLLFVRTNDFAENEDLQQLVIYNNYSINELNIYGSKPYTGQSKNEDRYSVFPFRYYSQSLGPVKYRNMLPAVTLKTFILGIQNLINTAFVFTDDNRVDIIDRETVLTGSSVDVDQYFTDSWVLGEKKNVVLEFKMKHDDNDELFSSFYKDLSKREADFGDDVATIAELEAITEPTFGELRRVLSQNQIYEYTIETVTDEHGMTHEQAAWKFISINFQHGRFNEEEGIDKDVETIETDFSTCANQVVPEVRQIGSFNLRKNSESAFSPRLVFVPYSNTAQNYTSNYFLGFEGPNNLLETRWPHTARFWANRQPVEGYFRFPAGVLASMINDVSTSGIRSVNHSKFSTRHGEFVIDKITTRFTHAGIGESKVEGWKVE